VFPTPTIALQLPECAKNSCDEYLAAGVTCATSPSINSCYCNRLSWPTACAQACVKDGDRSAVASWYWGLCPNSMDFQLGQMGVSRAKNSGVKSTVDAWAVQTNAVANGIVTTTGFDCYYSSQCGTITNSISSTTAAATHAPSGPQRKSNSSAIALGVSVPILAFLVLFLLYHFVYKRRRRRARNAPSHTSAPAIEQVNQEVFLDVLLATQQNQNESMQRIARAMERLEAVRRDPLPPSSSITSGPSSIITTDNSTNIQEAFENMERELLCPVCMNVFHNPVSVISRRMDRNDGCCKSLYCYSWILLMHNFRLLTSCVVHNFCGGCAVRVFNADSRCPVDRTDVVGVNDNRNLAQIVELFLRQFPDQRQSEEETGVLDALYRPGQRVSVDIESRFLNPLS
jgi:hypothetical protein